MSSTHSAYTCILWRFMAMSPSCFIITQSARCHPLLRVFTLRWHLFYTFRIGRLYKPWFFLLFFFFRKAESALLLPSRGSNTWRAWMCRCTVGWLPHECAGICQDECSALGFSAHYCPSGDTGRPPQNQLTPLHIIAFVHFCRCFRLYICIKHKNTCLHISFKLIFFFLRVCVCV